MQFPTLEPSWATILGAECTKQYFTELTNTIANAYQNATVYPSPENIFVSFSLCPFESLKVVILGQDPYHGEGQAQGLSFSVPGEARVPPSLKNIYKELANDLGIVKPTSGNLGHWAEQGVLLLNATLTVEASNPGSHQGLGWEQFTDAVVEKISSEKEHVVFLLWGKYAQSKIPLIDSKKHLVLSAPHPSPFSAHTGFFGCKHFSTTNTYLRKHNLGPIDW